MARDGPTAAAPVGEYLGLQGRFGQLAPEKVVEIQRVVDDDAALLAQRFRATAERVR